MSGYPRGIPETETPMWATEPLLLGLREQHRCREARGGAASGLSRSATTTPRRHFPPEAGPPVSTLTLPWELGVSLLSALPVAVPDHVGSWLAPFINILSSLVKVTKQPAGSAWGTVIAQPSSPETWATFPYQDVTDTLRKSCVSLVRSMPRDLVLLFSQMSIEDQQHGKGTY